MAEDIERGPASSVETCVVQLGKNGTSADLRKGFPFERNLCLRFGALTDNEKDCAPCRIGVTTDLKAHPLDCKPYRIT